MEVFGYISKYLAFVPAWVALILTPALFTGYTLAVALFGGRKSYPFVWALLGGAATALVAVRDLQDALLLAALFAVGGAALSLLFFLPVIPLKAKRERKIEAAGCLAGLERKAKLVGLEENPARYTLEQCGMKLAHVSELLMRLKKTSLAPSDQLEADALERNLAAYRARSLTDEELSRLNDALASVLKLTAKYKL